MTRLFLGACVLTVGLAVGLTGCDGVSTSPDDISKEDRTAAADSLRPTAKDPADIPDSLKQVAPGGTLTIPADSVANAPDDPQGDGPLRFDSVSVADTTLATVTKTNNDTEAVLDAAGASGTVTVGFRPAYGEFVATEADSFSVTIEEGNQPPVAMDDSDMTTAGQSTRTDVLDNDSDEDGRLEPSTVQVESGPSSGTASANNDGSVTYTPDDGFTGQDSYTYTVADDDGATSSEATVTIDVNEGNQPPTARDTTLTTDEDTETSGEAPGVLGNDTDLDEDDLSVSQVNGSAGDVGTETTLDSGALLTLSADGSYTYDPNDAFEDLGEEDTGSDSFTYTASDENGGTDQDTVDVTINGVNDEPDLTNKGLTVTEMDSVAIPTDSLSASDEDQDDGPSELTFTVKEEPDYGQLYRGDAELSSEDTFTKQDLLDEKVSYEHEASNVEDDNFKFDLTDDDGVGRTDQVFEITVEQP